jgi:hypothetical protein
MILLVMVAATGCHCFSAREEGRGNAVGRLDRLELKVTCCWNIPPAPENIPKIVDGAKSLGFNAIAWTSRRQDALLVKLCHEKGLKAYKVLEPLGIKKIRRENPLLQVMEPGEEQLPGAAQIPKGYLYQWGGEPVAGNREVHESPLACPNDPAVLSHTMVMVKEAEEIGYDGVCWDLIGYRNYHSCRCPRCTECLAHWRKTNPSAQESTFFENQLVFLYNDLGADVRKQYPRMALLCHTYPEFTDNPFYGRRLNVDWCGVTVSWFFPPHWPMEKVKVLADRVVNGGYERPGVAGMPLIGFYAGDFRKSPERIREELAAIKAVRARAIMMDELGDILGDPEIAKVVREALSDRSEGRAD